MVTSRRIFRGVAICLLPISAAGLLAGLLGVAIVAAGWSHAPTLHADSSASVQIPTTHISFASPELDALAANMAKEIVKKKARVVVVGGGGPQNKVTELGAGLRDAFNESLARQTQGARVLDGAGVRDDAAQEPRFRGDALYRCDCGVDCPPRFRRLVYHFSCLWAYRESRFTCG